MRPKELVLVNTSDNILFGGIPGAKTKELNENITQKVFAQVLLSKGQAGSRASSISQMYRCAKIRENPQSVFLLKRMKRKRMKRLLLPHQWAAQGLLSGAGGLEGWTAQRLELPS